MEQALIQVGLPVTCGLGDCETKGFVKPWTDYGGWYRSKLFRRRPRQKWFCPDHHQEGQAIDNRFYENYKTPDPEPEPENVEADLYKLLD
jgi:hypothetical protein